MHWRISPSGTHRIIRRRNDQWQILCPGSLWAEAGLPEETSEYADEGTELHRLTEASLEGGSLPQMSDRHRKPVETAVRQVESVRRRFDQVDYFGLEERIQHPMYPDFGGTMDVLIRGLIGGQTVQWVLDFKFGYQEVDTVWNTQFLSYTELALQKHGMTDLCYASVVQPQYYERPIRTSRYLHKDVDEFMVALMAAKNQEVYQPGTKQCQFCRAKGNCPALIKVTEQVEKSALECNENFRLPENYKLFLTREKLIKDHLEQIKLYIKEKIKNGEKVAGYKLTESLKDREWSYNAKAVLTKELELTAEELRQEIVKERSPAQIESILKERLDRSEFKEAKKIIGTITKRDLRGYALVDESSPKKGIDFSPESQASEVFSKMKEETKNG